MISLKLNEKVVMIQRKPLVTKSKYFAALIDGPMAKALNEDGTLTLDEEDADTFKDLMYFIREGVLPMTIMCDGVKLAKLRELASFYMVEFKFPSSPCTHIYHGVTSFTREEVAELEIYARLLDAKPEDANPAKPLKVVYGGGLRSKRQWDFLPMFSLLRSLGLVDEIVHSCSRSSRIYDKHPLGLLSKYPPEVLSDAIDGFEDEFVLIKTIERA
jgi:BTB/POZ domain